MMNLNLFKQKPMLPPPLGHSSRWLATIIALIAMMLTLAPNTAGATNTIYVKYEGGSAPYIWVYSATNSSTNLNETNTDAQKGDLMSDASATLGTGWYSWTLPTGKESYANDIKFIVKTMAAWSGGTQSKDMSSAVDISSDVYYTWDGTASSIDDKKTTNPLNTVYLLDASDNQLASGELSGGSTTFSYNPTANTDVKIKIGITSYGLDASGQEVTSTGTSNYTFTTSGSNTLSLSGSYNYTITVTSTGAVTVVANAKPVPITLINSDGSTTYASGTIPTGASQGTLGYNGDQTTDVAVKLTIGGVTYGLDAGATASKASQQFTFTAGGSGTLTLDKDYNYTFTVRNNGVVRVRRTAKPKEVADTAYYLVGNFFGGNSGADSKTEINYNRRYFKFEEKSTDGNTLSMYFPASITAYAQILAVAPDGKETLYGPGSDADISYNSISMNGSTNGSLSSTTKNSTNRFNMKTRNDGSSTGSDDGLYKISLTLNNGTPTSWSITHDALSSVCYLISNDASATAQSLFGVKRQKVDGIFEGRRYAFVHVSRDKEYYIISNILYNHELVERGKAYNAKKNGRNDQINPTTDKLLLQGNGGNWFSTDNHYDCAEPNNRTIKFNLDEGLYRMEINPQQGNYDLANSDNSLGISSHIQFQSGEGEAKAISMVGAAIPGTFNSATDWIWDSTVGDMTYNENTRAYELTLSTTVTAESKTKFRFVGDHTRTKNWGENSTDQEDLAAVPFSTGDGGLSTGHKATEEDMNDVSYYNSSASQNTDASYDIIWNRDAGLYTVRFYPQTYIGETVDKPFRYSITAQMGVQVLPKTSGTVKEVTTGATVIEQEHTGGADVHYFVYSIDGSDPTDGTTIDLTAATPTTSPSSTYGFLQYTGNLANASNPANIGKIEITPDGTGLQITYKGSATPTTLPSTAYTKNADGSFEITVMANAVRKDGDEYNFEGNLDEWTYTLKGGSVYKLYLSNGEYTKGTDSDSDDSDDDFFGLNKADIKYEVRDDANNVIAATDYATNNIEVDYQLGDGTTWGTAIDATNFDNQEIKLYELRTTPGNDDNKIRVYIKDQDETANPEAYRTAKYDITYSTSEGGYKDAIAQSIQRNTESITGDVTSDIYNKFPTSLGDKTYLVDLRSDVASAVTGVTTYDGLTTNSVLKVTKENGLNKSVSVTSGKSYTVQMLVEAVDADATATLQVVGSDSKKIVSVSKASGSNVTTSGRVDDLNSSAYLASQNFGSGNKGGWKKLEVTATASGSTLTFALSATNDIYVSNIVLLEDANTDGKIWSHAIGNTMATSIVDPSEIKDDDFGNSLSYKDSYKDLSNRTTKANAFSFFDRGDNLNAIIKASDKTVIGGGALDADGNTVANSASPVNTAIGSTSTIASLRLVDQNPSGTSPNDKLNYNSFGGFSESYTASSVYYDRYFINGIYQTICLPFDVTVSELQAAGISNVYTFSSVEQKEDGANLTFNELTSGSLTAGTPYMIKTGTTGNLKTVFTNKTIKGTAGTTQAYNDEKKVFHGTFVSDYFAYNDKDKPETWMFENYEGQFYPTADDKTGWHSLITPFRGYFTLTDLYKSGDAKRYSSLGFSINSSTPTGIDNVNAQEKASTAPVYNLSGQMVSRDGSHKGLKRGVYIQNNRKFVVR